jgi:hypothetical protein
LQAQHLLKHRSIARGREDSVANEDNCRSHFCLDDLATAIDSIAQHVLVKFRMHLFAQLRHQGHIGRVGGQKVKFTGLTQNSQVDAAV